MYATAMLVRALDGSESTSLSLYSHANTAVADYSKVEEIADENPGQHVRSVGGGMNRMVMAFIDVTSRDGLPANDFGRALALVDCTTPRGTKTLDDVQCGVRWHVSNKHEKHPEKVLKALVNELAVFYTGEDIVAPAGLEVLVAENDEGLLFSLAEPTRKRIQKQHPDVVLPKRLFIDRDTLHAMDAAGRADLGTFASLVTGLSDDELQEQNAVIVDTTTKKQYWRAKR